MTNDHGFAVCWQGHDCVPMLYGHDDGGAISFLAKLEETNKGQTAQKFS